MAYVSDFNEEELQRALAAAGGAPQLSAGPASAASGGGSTPAAAIPASGGAPSAGGSVGTGFVNLGRYFDANSEAAQKSADALTVPLQQDLAPIGQAAYDATPRPTPGPAPKPVQAPLANDKGQGLEGGGNPGLQAQLDAAKAANAANLAGYNDANAKAAAEAESLAQANKTKAIQDAQIANVNKGRSYLEDPNRLREALSTNGQNPTAFDTYLTGAAMPQSYQGLFNYYGGAAAGADNPNGPGQPGGGRQPFTSTPLPAPTAASAMDPQQRKKSKNLGGW